MALPPQPKLRDLKAAAQLSKPILKVGKHGVSAEFLAALNTALTDHELVKIKFDEFKDQKKVLAPELALKTESQLVQRVGNTAVFYRARRVEAA